MTSANLTASEIGQGRSSEDLPHDLQLVIPKSKLLEDYQASELLVDLNDSYEEPSFWSGRSMAIVSDIYSWVQSPKKRIFKTAAERKTVIYAIADESVDPLL